MAGGGRAADARAVGGGMGGPRRCAALAAGAALLAASGAAIWLLADRTSLPARLVLLAAAAVSAISLVVGYGLGFYADRGRRPGE